MRRNGPGILSRGERNIPYDGSPSLNALLYMETLSRQESVADGQMFGLSRRQLKSAVDYALTHGWEPTR